MSILTRNGEKKIVPDVYYVPGLKCNLLSIGQFMNKGYNVFFNINVCTIMDIPLSKRVIVEVHMKKNRMFPLKLRIDLKERRNVVPVTQEAFKEEVKDENWLWH